MGEKGQLETPVTSESIFLACDDVDGYALRPLMTGDVLERSDGSWVVLVQHPCAMRAGADLLPRLLACEVVHGLAPFRSKWSSERHYVMPLLALGNTAVNFNLPVVLGADEALALRRVAIMERAGVNLLLQRWVHHNSRAVIHTVTYDEQSTGPFAEADLVFEGLVELNDSDVTVDEGHLTIEEFLNGSPEGSSDVTWRGLLRDQQNHATVRRALDAAIADRLKKCVDERGEELVVPD